MRGSSWTGIKTCNHKSTMNSHPPLQPVFEADIHVDQHVLLIPKHGRPELSLRACALVGKTPTPTRVYVFAFGCTCRLLSSHHVSVIDSLLVLMRLDTMWMWPFMHWDMPLYVGLFALTHVSTCQWSCIGICLTVSMYAQNISTLSLMRCFTCSACFTCSTTSHS